MMNLIDLMPTQTSNKSLGSTKRTAKFTSKEKGKHMTNQLLALAKELGRRPTEAEIGQRMKEVFSCKSRQVKRSNTT